MLASRVLTDRGFTVTMATRERVAVTPQPSWHHVHVLAESTLAALEQLAPGTRAQQGSLSERRPDREMLDHALAATCLPAVEGRTIAGPFTMDWRGDEAIVRWQDRETWRGNVVVDASGAARASCPAMARRLGRPVPMDALAGTGRYTSTVLLGVTVPSDDGFLGVRGPEMGWGALLLALDDGAARITVQTPAAVRITTADGLRAAWEGLGDAVLNATCRAGRPDAGLHRWGPHPTMRVVLEECDDAPPGWFPVGDALLVTPPHLARGFAQLVEQVALLGRLHPETDNHAEVRRALAELSAARWMDAAMTEGLTALQ